MEENEERVRASSPFGMLLRRYRLAAKLSQGALAERARMSSNGISALERGDRQTPQRETLALLTQALRLDDEQRRAFEVAAARPAGLRPGDRRVSVLPERGGDDAPVVPNTNLSPSLTSFVGRETELREILTLVREHRLVTLTGAGGIGKTRVALEVGAQSLDAMSDGVWLANLAPLHDPSLAAGTIARVLEVDVAPNRPVLETTVAYLKHKNLLLIVDNCEHVIAQAAIVVNAMLRGCPHLRILTTSRERLRVAGEHTYRLPSLDIPSREAAQRLTAADAGTYAAVVLFAQRARAVDRRFTLTDEQTPIVAEICRRLDGIPLAIELAAARVSILPVKAFAERLDQRLALLSSGDRTALPHHRTMRALIDWSYDLLTAPEQHLFERLSVFAGGCTLGAATRVCGDDETEELEMIEMLGSLVDKSMLVADARDHEPRYVLLETLREYAAEKLADRGELRVIAQRHALEYDELAAWFECGFDEGFEPEWPSLIDAELENWRSALDWTLAARGDVELGQRLVGELRPVWVNARVGSVAAEGRRWVQAALDLVDVSTPLEIIARLEFAEAAIAFRFAEAKQTLTSGERALVRYREIGDRRGTAGVLRLVGQSLVRLGRPEEAEPSLREGLDLARQLGMYRVAGGLLMAIAFARSVTGDLNESRAYASEALATLRAIGDEYNAANALAHLAETEFRGGNVGIAGRLAEESLKVYRKLGRLNVNVLNNLAAYFVAMDRYDEAYVQARETVELARERQQRVTVAMALQHLAAIVVLRESENIEPSRSKAARGARVMGFTDAQVTALGAPRQYTEQQEYERVTTALRKVFDQGELEMLLLTGASMTDDQVIDEALTV